jgi:hypothetical protein
MEKFARLLEVLRNGAFNQGSQHLIPESWSNSQRSHHTFEASGPSIISIIVKTYVLIIVEIDVECAHHCED